VNRARTQKLPTGATKKETRDKKGLRREQASTRRRRRKKREGSWKREMTQSPKIKTFCAGVTKGGMKTKKGCLGKQKVETAW